MDFFVPDRWNSFPHISELTTIASLIRIDERDLGNVLKFWKKCENVDPTESDCDVFLTEQACKHPVARGEYVDYMLNATAVTFGGAFEGKDKKTAVQLMDLAHEIGYLIALNGFNLRYGGGETGLMGQFLAGYLDAVEDLRSAGRPVEHLKIVQATSAHFLMPNASKNGNRPPNEGLCHKTDAVVVFPGDLTNRISFMRSFCECFIAAPGAMGTPHELYDVMTEIKIGLKTSPLYVIDPLVQSLAHKRGLKPRQNRLFRAQALHKSSRYFSGIFDYNQSVADRGMITQEQNDSFAKRFYTPKEAMDCLMADQAAKGRLPKDVFRMNCKRLLKPENLKGGMFLPHRHEVAALGAYPE